MRAQFIYSTSTNQLTAPDLPSLYGLASREHARTQGDGIQLATNVVVEPTLFGYGVLRVIAS